MKTYIRRYYEELYRRKEGMKPPVMTGKPLAAELGYPASVIEAVPDELWEDFLPCGNILPHVRPGIGDIVLNLGCGAGVDSLALMELRGNRFGIVNLDIVYSVLLTASKAARQILPSREPDWIRADGEALPFASGSFKWVMLNGVLNLFPDKGKLVGELSRVLDAGGTVAGADLCRAGPLPDYFRDEPDAWAWCMSGALTEEELDAAFESAGFKKTGFTSERMDEFFSRATFVYEKAARI
jgi:SAM-dependent methyltransferase